MRKTGLRDGRGSATLEAAIIFPVILLMVLAFIFFSMFVYHRLVLVDTAVYAASQRAVTWDNSYKDVGDGRMEADKNDGLYWRIFNDFDTSGLVRCKAGAAEDLIGERLGQVIYGLKEPQSISVEYRNRLITRTVSVDIKHSVDIPFGWLAGAIDTDVEVLARSQVTEPAEYIRTVDLTAEYMGRIKDYMFSLFDGGGEQESRTVVVTKANNGGDRVYHTGDCPAAGRILPGNREEMTEAEARLAGYRQCKLCAARSGNGKQ
ncbi:MAG: TadE family protein [Bacillota bacterium]